MRKKNKKIPSKNHEDIVEMKRPSEEVLFSVINDAQPLLKEAENLINRYPNYITQINIGVLCVKNEQSNEYVLKPGIQVVYIDDISTGIPDTREFKFSKEKSFKKDKVTGLK